MTPEQVSRMYKPGVVPLRPLTLSDIYDGTFQTLRRNPRATWGMALVVMTIATLLGVGASALVVLVPDIGAQGVLDVSSLISAPFNILGILVLAGLMSYVVSAAAIGEKVTFSQSWDRVKGRIWPLIGVSLLTVFIGTAALLPAIISFIVGLALGESGGGVLFLILAGLLAIVGFLALFYLSVKVSLATPVVVLEKAGPITAIRRSWRLTSTASQFWRIFGITFLTGIIVIVVSYIVAIPMSIVAALLFSQMASESAALAGITITLGLANLIAYVVTAPFQSSVTALLYIDQRIRREGLHVQMQRAANQSAESGPTR
ncbi:glycerophosphoryl diester phosphodiesterase membrane domain-containing protein [Ornithinimicrobium sp. INDO-MA30-4]|uniref:glycerophosphoryl diester phosphodiesterase membrane domain-containing protein n=1 Tax=Ornithinimicrobium sp. INDO-MA30-4 TaxID=2908651 RepID=UPI001F33DB75|nr:glycerophosphoryl diester phosphodiesterase membrane domain-containing protein [Ornithinimicrobium sp. INDO-MA30-4]UJH71458.1 glycerophosphoryl diester phosphodiesterase membrane domain-containing protein [Ornithinimicrobium sp. INDO-MA30-4]